MKCFQEHWPDFPPERAAPLPATLQDMIDLVVPCKENDSFRWDSFRHFVYCDLSQNYTLTLQAADAAAPWPGSQEAEESLFAQEIKR